MTTQTFFDVKAGIFIDCSGDSILAPLSGADFRMGRESAEEYGREYNSEITEQRYYGHELSHTVPRELTER